MIITRDMNPRVMTYKSRDFQYLLKLLDLMANSIKLDIDYFTNLIDPNKCKSSWLEPLASVVGYKYDHSLTTDQNRFIISNYKSLVRLRGSKGGIELAVATYLKLIGRDDTNFRVTIPTVDNENSGMLAGTIYINDESLDVSKALLLSKLLEIVRPVGVNYVVRKAQTSEIEDTPIIRNSVTTYEMIGNEEGYVDISVRYQSENLGTGYSRSETLELSQTGASPDTDYSDELEYTKGSSPENVMPDNVIEHSEASGYTPDTNEQPTNPSPSE